MFSLESPHGGDSNEYTQCTIFNIKKNICPCIPNLQLWDFVPRDSKDVRNSHGKQASSVRAIEVLLYIAIRLVFMCFFFFKKSLVFQLHRLTSSYQHHLRGNHLAGQM